MKTQIPFIFVALLVIACSAKAQELTLQASGTGLVVNANGLTAMTALQFNLELPEGASITNEATLGKATDNHTLCIDTLDNGDHLFILYSMDLNTFSDGELLRISLITNEGTARLYNVRFADTEAVSHEGAEVATGIKTLSNSLLKGENIFNLAGQRLSKMQKGINIKDGKKFVVK